MPNSIVAVLALLVLCGCQQQEEPRQTPSAAETPEVAPLRKISIRSPAEVDSLRRMGIEPIVIESTYVVARLPEARQQAVAAMGLTAMPVREEDLVQRLVEIVVSDPQQKNALADLGMDIWHVSADTVVAQAFDSQIVAARDMGLEVRIVEADVRNVVKRLEGGDDAAADRNP